jgi:hypothetical protein
MKRSLRYLPAILLTAFGLLTLFLSCSIIFDLFGIRAKEGNYVLFVVGANFICSFLYLLSAYGFVKNKKWTFWVLGIAALILVLTIIGFTFHIISGAIYETKTIGALTFRITVTLTFLAIAYFNIHKKL